MRERALVLGLLLLASACGGVVPPPDGDLELRIEVEGSEVELGRAFPLAVVRTWNAELVPEDWSDELLSPLVVRLEDVSRRGGGGFVQETRTYEAYAFALDQVTIPAPTMSAQPRSGGAERTITGNELALNVVPALPPGEIGAPELPSGLLGEPASLLPYAGFAAAVVALIVLAWILRRRKPAPAPPAPAPETTEVDAFARAWPRLQRLREERPASREEIQAYHVEASAAVREYVEDRFAIHAPKLTTEELRAAARVLEELTETDRTRLAETLGHCDLVKFARLASSDIDRERLLDAAAAFLEETQPPEPVVDEEEAE